MKTNKNIQIFRNIIKYYFIIFILFLVKAFFFPDVFIPEDLKFVIRKYEDEVMTYSYPIVLAGILFAFIYLFSFFMLYKLKKNWRIIHIISLIVTLVCLLEYRFSFVDSFDFVFEGLMFMLDGSIISLAFFGTVSKEFK